MKLLFKFVFLLIFPLAFLLSVALLVPYTGYLMVKTFLAICRFMGVHVLKTTVDQIPFASQPEIVNVEFITDQDTYYKLRKACNEKGIWFIRPIWTALDAHKWVYSVMLANKR